jgi:glycosyltransferase involved in cell wall biosynthesis
MLIVVVSDFAFVNGGAGAIALGSAKGLAQRGHDVILFSAVGPIADDLLATAQLRHECLGQANVWEDPNVAAAALRGLWNLPAYRRLKGLLATVNPTDTVVHLHSWTKALSPSVIQGARSSGVPVVVTLHDFFSVCPTGTLFNHETASICELTPLSRACIASNCDARSYAHKLWRVGRHVMQLAAGLPRDVRDLIVVSDASARQFRSMLPGSVRLHQVPNFADVPRGEPTAVEDNQAIAYVGRLSAEKGAVLLAATAQRRNIPLVFIGEGADAAAVRETCPAAEVTGWLAPDQVRQRLRRSARALAFPSLWYETQGLVVAEAAALGIPAIVPDSSAARDWVEDGVSGLWFRGGDADDLGEKMAALMADPALARRMGQEAYRRFWASPPTLDRHLDGLERVYRSLLGGCEPVNAFIPQLEAVEESR